MSLYKIIIAENDTIIQCSVSTWRWEVLDRLKLLYTKLDSISDLWRPSKWLSTKMFGLLLHLKVVIKILSLCFKMCTQSLSLKLSSNTSTFTISPTEKQSKSLRTDCCHFDLKFQNVTFPR